MTPLSSSGTNNKKPSFIALQFNILCAKGDEAFENEGYLQAITFYSEALSLSPNDEDVLGCRCVVYAKLGMFNESKKDAESLISIIPQKPKVSFVYTQYQSLLASYIDCNN